MELQLLLFLLQDSRVLLLDSLADALLGLIESDSCIREPLSGNNLPIRQLLVQHLYLVLLSS